MASRKSEWKFELKGEGEVAKQKDGSFACMPCPSCEHNRLRADIRTACWEGRKRVTWAICCGCPWPRGKLIGEKVEK